jgi:hypothetical protein
MHDSSVRLAELATIWNKVERRAKAAEQFRGEAIIAAINEMRYAGRRIVDAWALASKPDAEIYREQIDEHLVIAKSYLMNADHDLTDSVCFIVIKRVDATVARHGLLKTKRECPEFDRLYPAVITAKDIVQGSREDRARRNAEYDRLSQQLLPQLETLFRHLQENRELALTDATTAQFREVWGKLDFLQRVVFVGAGAGIGGFILEVIDLLFMRGHGLP